MVAGMSKRQQFRNERALQDLIRSVPGNDRCADCEAMNPGWASWNMGIFLCMRCATLHRKMGTHISKVKSLSMDSWTTEQVDNMKSHGNTLMNKIFNPRNVKPPVPADVDESDACMERFIRQKYQHRSLDDGKPNPPSRQDTGNDRSPEGSPPPLPPKPNRPFGFGLRSASSTTSLHRLSTRQATSPRSETYESPPPPLPTRTGSLGMGASVGDTSFESKMVTLRSMGFTNEYRNSAVLKGLDGNLDKSIETLVRLGEGNGSITTLRGRAPVHTTTAGDSTRQQAASTNPFDQLDSKPSQPAGASYNPFDVPTPQPPAQPLEASFQNLQVSQPLFPHSTGGYPSHQTSLPQPLYQQPITPPVMPTISQGAFVQSPQAVEGGHNPFFQPGSFAQAQNQTPGLGQTNPFFTQPPPQPNMMQQPSQAPAGYPHPPRHANTMPAMSSISPFGQGSPFQQQQQQQQQQQIQPPHLQVQPPQQMQGSHNPFQPMTAPPTPQSAGYQVQSHLGLQAPAQHLAPQTTGRMDKSSILSLYGLSPPPSATSEQHTQMQSPAGLNPAPGPAAPSYATNPTLNPQQQLSDAGTRNPFLSATQPTAPGLPQQQQQQPYLQQQQMQQQQPYLQQQQMQPQSQPQYTTNTAATTATPFNMPVKPTTTNPFPRTQGHMSQQSVDINAFQNGRHSPDAFASLSARYS
ncbi:hypothetical protein BDV29DRAFT_166518 [Aspergillus leporis]|uniref:Arf-GAP domain-containing protein n=1 Tax=Aspergillus leporis TaxID=41062 RepID=A0A5N5XG30_9EURO|nr:hypothetical protein BDV29DRAFT_166518 [Aspergillus leporis]